jgi:hypothetical protein
MSKTNRKRNFGMSDMEFNRRCDLQGWTCAICKGVDLDKRPSKYPGRAQSLRVDHCHRHTGPMVKVRGLLCHRCNTGLGSFRDSLGLLRAAQQYLLDHG